LFAVLRIGHRPARDKRITTHVALVARTFGAERIWIDEADEKIEENIRGVTSRFGGPFAIESGVSWKKVAADWKEKGGLIAHLTMYGMPADESCAEMRDAKKDILLVVGAEKVPREIYEIADFNVAVGNQPHSEVAALAITLDRLTSGEWINRRFHGGSLEIIPAERGKNVIASEVQE